MSVLRTVLDKLSAGPSYQFNSRIVNILRPQRREIIAETWSYIFRWRSPYCWRRLCLSFLFLPQNHGPVFMWTVTRAYLPWLYVSFNALTAVGALIALIDFTLSNARRFYSSMGNPLAGKGLKLGDDKITVKIVRPRTQPWSIIGETVADTTQIIPLANPEKLSSDRSCVLLK